jgi:hypothetical protein
MKDLWPILSSWKTQTRKQEISSNHLFDVCILQGDQQGCQIFLGAWHQNRKKMYQMNTQCGKWSYNIPNGLKIFQIATKYINIFPSETLEIFSLIGIFGLKTNHLPTLPDWANFRPMVDYLLRLVFWKLQTNSYLVNGLFTEGVIYVLISFWAIFSQTHLGSMLW